MEIAFGLICSNAEKSGGADFVAILITRAERASFEKELIVFKIKISPAGLEPAHIGLQPIALPLSYGERNFINRSYS